MPRSRTGYFCAGVLLLSGVCASSAGAAREVIDRDGCVVDSVFDADWRKYSDFDDTLNPASRSLAVQGYEDTQAEIRAINEEITSISAHMELDAAARVDARKLEQALRQNQQANLLRAFWRLAWITFNTIGGPTGKTGMIKTGRAYAELFTDQVSVASTAKMLGIVKKLVPKQYSKLPGNEGRVVNVGVDALLDAVKNSGKSRVEQVASVVTTVLNTAGNEALGAGTTSPDISPEEIAILRQQYLDRNRLKEAIAASYELNRQRKARIEILETQARAAADKAAEWAEIEKQRVYAQVNKNCRKPPALQFAVAAPTRITAGEIGDIAIKLPPGRDASEFVYAWGFAGDLLVNDSLNAQFQSMRLGAHPISVQFFDKAEQRNLGMIRVTIEVVPPQAVVDKPAVRSGRLRVAVSALTVKPPVLKPGDVVEVNVAYTVSGLPDKRRVPVTLRYRGQGAGQHYEKSSRGAVGNGNYDGWYQLSTTGWKPGRYTVEASVDLPGAADSAGGEFVLRQPDVAATKPPPAPVRPPAPARRPAPPATGSAPPPPPAGPTTRAADFVGDWQGTGTVTHVAGFDGWRRGTRTPMKVRIAQQGGVYRVYDLLDPDTPSAPMHTQVIGDKLVFSYRGPAVDTEGYEHPEMPIDVSWTLSLTGNRLSGDFVLAMDEGNVTINVQATRVR